MSDIPLYFVTSFIDLISVVLAAPGQKAGTGPAVKGVDPDAEGIVNGVSVFEFNLDSLKDEEKPWRKPGNYI